MKQKQKEILKAVHRETGEPHGEMTELYPGIGITFFSVSGQDSFRFCHEPLAHVMEINYCISGKIGWNMYGGNQIYLGSGDFSLNTMDTCVNSIVTLPNGSYEGIVICIDLEQLTDAPPMPLAGSSVTGELLLEKYFKGGTCTVLAGNEIVQQIFQALYQSPEETRTAWQKVKVLELLLVLSGMEVSREKHLTEYRSEQVEIIRQVHDQLIENLEQRCSIESLSKQYLMNPTTLKNMFKEIYGTSIAAHIREHRMEAAAQLLQSTDLSVADVARKVGYDSQSRFSDTFKRHFGVLPKEYRKNLRK